MTSNQQLLSQQFPDFAFRYDFSLAKQSYFKIGGTAEVYFETQSKEELLQALDFCYQEHIKTTLIAGISNSLITDNGISGLVIKITANTFEELGPDPDQKDHELIRAEAGIQTALLVRKTIDAGLTGLEYFLGVPGLLGGAVFNNAHYLSHLISEYIVGVEVIAFDESSHRFQTLQLPASDCDFAYDHSRFQKSQEIIWPCSFSLPKGDKKKSLELISQATQYRAKTQPLGEPSSGCIFQNVPNTPELQKRFPQFAQSQHVPAAFLIDRAGLKGRKIGSVSVSHKHASFIINEGNGSSEQVMELIGIIKDRVKSEFGVELKEEIFIL